MKKKTVENKEIIEGIENKELVEGLEEVFDLIFRYFNLIWRMNLVILLGVSMVLIEVSRHPLDQMWVFCAGFIVMILMIDIIKNLKE